MANTDWELQCYGCTEEVLKKFVLRESNRWIAPVLIATSILSDAQEEILRGLDEQARQHINCAKWIINQDWKQENGEWVWGKRVR